MNHQEYIRKILEKLESKYGKQFEIIQATYEVSGNVGNFYRVVCKEKENDIKFNACYYMNGSKYLLSEEIEILSGEENGEPVLIDEYCVALLNKQVADCLISGPLHIKLALVDIKTVAHVLTIEDLYKGVEYCLSNDEFDVKASVYLFLDNQENRLENEKAIIEKINQLALYKCSLDIAYVVDSMEDVKNDYANMLYSIEEKLDKDQRIIGYTRYVLYREKGIAHKETVKGE